MSNCDNIYRYCHVIDENVQVKKSFFDGNEKFECMDCAKCKKHGCRNERFSPMNNTE